MNSTVLKLIALLLMFCDHVAQFIPGAPIWFHWIGRIAAPLFMFCMVWGYHYTHNRKQYIIRMYLFGVAMGCIGLILNVMVPNAYCAVSNNIFVELLLVAIMVSILECRKVDKKQGNKWILYFVLFQIVSTAVCMGIGQLIPVYGIESVVSAFIPNVFFCEGGILFTFLGVLMYFTKDTKSGVIKGYGTFCLIYFLISCAGNMTYEWLFEQAYQWLMIGALPFMLLYNNKKGKGLKYLFYLFYPIHIIVLFLIGNYFTF